jgi:hypothetical protein
MDEVVGTARLALLRTETESKRSRSKDVVRKIGLDAIKVPSGMRICLDLAETHYAHSLKPDNAPKQTETLLTLAIDLYDTFLHNAASILGVKP